MDQNDDNYQWPMTNDDLATLFKRSPKTLRRHKNRNSAAFTKGEDFIYCSLVKHSPGNLLWTKNGAIKLAEFIKSKEAALFLERLGLSKAKRYNIEDDCISIISRAIDGFSKYTRQYPVQIPIPLEGRNSYFQYLIDLYIIDYKIAVECDEEGHRNKPKGDEEYREQCITKRLGCTFVRFDPYILDFNIGDVINKIFKLMLNK